MGCVPSSNMVLIREQLKFCNLQCVFSYERKENDLLYKPRSYFSKEFSPTIGIIGNVIANVQGVSDDLIQMIQQTIESNLFFKNEQYLEGFENSAEIITSFFKSGLKFVNKFSKAEVVKPHPYTDQIIFSVNCMMKIDDRLYFMKIPSLTYEKNIKIIKSIDIEDKNENQTELAPNLIGGFEDISEFVSELNPDYVKKASHIILSDEKLPRYQGIQDQVEFNPIQRNKIENPDLQQIHIFLSDEEYEMYNDV